jgi:ABC-type multidrug transport system fused ATPase/permease subunit
VVLLVDGRVAAEGTHEELLQEDPDYREVVVRSLEDSHV